MGTHLVDEAEIALFGGAVLRPAQHEADSTVAEFDADAP